MESRIRAGRCLCGELGEGPCKDLGRGRLGEDEGGYMADCEEDDGECYSKGASVDKGGRVGAIIHGYGLGGVLSFVFVTAFPGAAERLCWCFQD